MGATDLIVQTLQFSRDFVLGLADDIPENEVTRQPIPGGNHCLWILGHLAHTENAFIGELDPTRAIPLEGYEEKFGTGSTPVADPAAYPSRERVLAVMRERREVLLPLVTALSDEDLARPTGEPFAAFAPTVGSLLSLAAGHEMMHAGQLTVCRRSLGMPPRM